MTKLYELSANYQNLLALTEDDSIPQEVVIEALKAVEGEIIDKAQNIAKLLKNMDGDIKAFKDEENRLKTKRAALERKYESLKIYLEEELRKTGIRKVDGVVPVAFRKSPPSVEIQYEELIPEQFQIIEKKLDKRKILESLKSGETVPGARLVEDREYLKIG